MGEVFKLNHCYNMDCLPAMELFPDNYFDLAVVDPPYFSGPERSGSSRIAAYEAGLGFIGFEIDPFYFQLEEERFSEHTSQTSLFHMEGKKK